MTPSRTAVWLFIVEKFLIAHVQRVPFRSKISLWISVDRSDYTCWMKPITSSFSWAMIGLRKSTLIERVTQYHEGGVISELKTEAAALLRLQVFL